MTMVDVVSSNVRQIGYDAELRLLRVIFHSGDTYDYPDVSPETWEALMDAPSKGSFMASHLKGRGTKHGGQAIRLREPAVTISNLQSFEPDDCCGAALSRALKSGQLESVDTWTHEKCGQQWKGTMRGVIKFWEPAVMMEVFKQ